MQKPTLPVILADFYKISHVEQYPEGTELVYSTWTPRDSRKEGITSVVAFGYQAFIKEYLVNYFSENFFSRNEEEVVSEYVNFISKTLGVENPKHDHIRKLHALGYMPLKIMALPEGTSSPIRVPQMTIENTLPEFYWVTNFIETLMSCQLWMASTSATIAKEYRRILDYYASVTNGDLSGVCFQGHDFSMRGMSSLESAKLSGSGHLLSFVGTDTIPAIDYLSKYYNADINSELVGTSIPATEHSVMCAHGKGNEFEAYKRIVTEVYPNGFVSIVSDTWDLWKVLTEIIAPLKDNILHRNGRVVIRPDSGDPVDIVCGTVSGKNEWEIKGVIEILWDIFGGTITEKGFKQLDSHIGCIYGDAITIERCTEICKRLEAKGFASTNMVYGIGSYTYQYNTRDTFGFALKSTYAVINGEEHLLFKDPITDNGIKKSQCGKVAVVKDGTSLKFVDHLNKQEFDDIENNEMQTIFKDGKLVKETSLKEVRSRI